MAQLISVADFKTYIGKTDTTDDVFLSALAVRASGAVEKYVDRTFTLTTYREIKDGLGTRDIFLDQKPITSVTLLATSREAAMSIKNSSTDAYHAYIEIEDSTLTAPTMTLVVQGGTNAGSNTITLSDHSTLTALVVAIEALSAGWSIETIPAELARWDPVELLPTTGQNATRNNVELFIPFEPRWQYVTDRDAGIITLNTPDNKGFQDVVVKYTAGFATVPEDVQQITIDLTNVYWRGRKRDGGLKSEKIGDYSYTQADTDAGNLPLSIKARLFPYRINSL